MSRSPLEQKLKALIAADAAVISELLRLYPIGMDVQCWLQHGQVNPSHGQVIGHTGGQFGCVLVRLESRTREVRSVPAEKILD